MRIEIRRVVNELQAGRRTDGRLENLSVCLSVCLSHCAAVRQCLAVSTATIISDFIRRFATPFEINPLQCGDNYVYISLLTLLLHCARLTDSVHLEICVFILVRNNSFSIFVYIC